MRQERDEGIVLRCSWQRVALLSERKGRIDLLLFSKKGPSKLSCGMFVSYTEKQGRTHLGIMEDMVIEYIPLAWARQDIYFLHYLLELCYYFIPVGSREHHFLSLIKQIYKNFDAFKSIYKRKLVLCKLLSHLGVIPDEEVFQSCAQILLNTHVDNIGITDLELIIEDTLDDWLTWCISSHPRGKWFKAIPSLLKSEAQ